MEYLKKYGISLGFTSAIIIVSLLIITIFNYFNIIGPKMLVTSKILILLVSLFIGGYINGKKSKENGWLEGIKLSLILIALLFIISIIIPDSSFSIKTIIFYFIVILDTVLGSMFGINKRRENTV